MTKTYSNLVKNFFRRLILKVFLRAILINFNNVLRNRLCEVELRMSAFSLFHSLMILGMREFLKYSDVQKTVLNELTCRRELLIDGSNS